MGMTSIAFAGLTSSLGCSSSRKKGPSRGSDLRFNMSITLQEAFGGKKSQIRIPSYVGCD